MDHRRLLFVGLSLCGIKGITMQTQHVESFTVVGFKTRTQNQDERTPATAKIGPLWQRFFSQAAPHLQPASKIYGVYTGYESDFTAHFDVYAASNTLSVRDVEGLETLDIQAGRYAVFTAEGEMPQACIDLWGEVWRYFQDENAEYQRAYTTDFEYYAGPNQISIY